MFTTFAVVFQYVKIFFFYFIQESVIWFDPVGQW